MELDEQSQPQLKDSSTSQIAQSTITPKRESQGSALHASSPNKGANHLLDQENPNLTTNVKDEAINEDLVDQEFFDHLPPGYRFNPTDVELILHYLEPKTGNKRLPRNQIRHVNLYDYSPDEITARYKESKESEWYFFTPRERKYRNGNRPNRAAPTGYWKATGADKSIRHNGVEIGFRKALVFYEGKPPKGEKTSWIMHEYRVKEETPKKKRSKIDMRLDDYILCRIYKKTDKIFKSRQHHEVQNQDIQHDEDFDTSKEQKDGSCMNVYGDHASIPPPLQSFHSHQPPLQSFHPQQSQPPAMNLPHQSFHPHQPPLQSFQSDPQQAPLQSFHPQQPQQLAMNMRVMPIHFPPTNFAPLIYSAAENMSGYLKDENMWSLPENQLGMKPQELSEFDFPEIKYEVDLPELDNIFFSMYAPPDDLSAKPG